MSVENNAVKSIHDLLEAGRITGVLVNGNNFETALSSALACKIEEIPPVIAGDQTVTVNGKTFRIINWVDFDKDFKVGEDIPWGSNPYLSRSVERNREITKINIEVHTSGQVCIMFAGYEPPINNELFYRDIQCLAPMKALFLTSTTVIVKHNGLVTTVRQSNRLPTGGIPPFKI